MTGKDVDLVMDHRVLNHLDYADEIVWIRPEPENNADSLGKGIYLAPRLFVSSAFFPKDGDFYLFRELMYCLKGRAPWSSG